MLIVLTHPPQDKAGRKREGKERGDEGKKEKKTKNKERKRILRSLARNLWENIGDKNRIWEVKNTGKIIKRISKTNKETK